MAKASGLKYIDEFILDRIDSKKTRLESMLLDKTSLKNILRDILIEYTYTSNKIDGSALSIEETRRIIESGNDFLGKAPYFQHLTINHVNAFQYISRNTRTPVTTSGVLELHEIAMRNVDKEAGVFRDKYTQNKIEDKLDTFLDTMNNSPQYHAIEKAAILQSYFYQIRPFNYGTGVTARLVSKWVLNYASYIFGLDLNDFEIKYYRKCAEKSGQGTIYPLVKLMTKCVENTLDLLISRVKSLNITPIEDIMSKNRLTVDQVYDYIKRGQIKAFKKDGTIYVIDHGIDKIARGAELLELII